jgi:hypothetical protein
MKTDEFVSLLATGTDAVDVRAPARRYVAAIAGGTVVATVLMALWLDVRPTLARDATLPMFWVKELFCVALAAAGLFAVARLSRPGAALARLETLAGAPILGMWLLAAVALAVAVPEDRTALIQGVSWTECPYNIAVLSVPVFAAIVWAMRGFAPTHLRRAGAAAGFAAGAIGALAYTLHCPELDAPFLALWYVAGILIPTVVGAVIGPRLLRW